MLRIFTCMKKLYLPPLTTTVTVGNNGSAFVGKTQIVLLSLLPCIILFIENGVISMQGVPIRKRGSVSAGKILISQQFIIVRPLVLRNHYKMQSRKTLKEYVCAD